jgi:hypothetical protein
MKRFVTTFIAIIIAFSSKGEYRYLSLSQLVCRADFAAMGTIVALDENYFYLKVDEYVLGRLEIDTLAIQRFSDWACGMRAKPYAVGQEELVFFQKSNYVIDQYELLGYGMGGEFELPMDKNTVYYNSGYNEQQPYKRSSFLRALRDLHKYREILNDRGASSAETERTRLIRKSSLHRRFIECRDSQDYDLYGTASSHPMDIQIPEGQEIPKPQLCFGEYGTDSISSRWDALPFAAHYNNLNERDKNLAYEVLGYTITIQTEDETFIYEMKSSKGTREFFKKLRLLKEGDILTYSHILVLYPDQTVHPMEDHRVYHR